MAALRLSTSSFPFSSRHLGQWSGILKPSGGVIISPAGIAHTNPFPHDHGPARHGGGGFGGAPFEFGKLSLSVDLDVLDSLHHHFGAASAGDLGIAFGIAP